MTPNDQISLLFLSSENIDTAITVSIAFILFLEAGGVIESTLLHMYSNQLHKI